tara:strand:+ start:3203 stop:3865 length:663 start_codon:yes stop_codon:yes gene_type:complete
MEKGTTKIIFWSVTALILIGGGYYGYTLYEQSQKEKKEKEEEDKKEKEEAEKPKKEYVYVETNQSVSTGFKTKAEGDAFRKYVIANYPADAKKWDLDPSGSEDNSTIRKAYSFYGEIYKKSLSNSTVVVDTSALKVGDYVNAKKSTGVYTSNTMVKRYPMGNVTGILSGTLLKGYYAGLIKEIDLNKGSVKVSNGTYQAVDEDGGKHILYWVKLSDLEKK